MSGIKTLSGGSAGFGILTEQDAGYISPFDERNETFINEMNKIATGKGGQVMVEPLVLFVVLQKHGVKNKNGRIYPKDILTREANNYQKLIDSRSAIGEAEHPESSVINTSRVSHEIKKIWWERNTLVGEIELIMSPGFVNQGIISCEGDNIANLLRKGIRVGVSSRGLGSVQKIGDSLVVQDDFELICWDIVATPSTPGSYMFSNKADGEMFIESEEKKKPALLDELNKFLLK
jgi:hypothetical protein